MALVYYDANGSSGTGTILFENIEGGIPISAFQLIANDYNEAGITTPGFITSIVSRWTVYVQCTNLGIAPPFTSTPDTRYKLGTFVPHGGYDIIVSPEGEQINPYYRTPEFLIYPNQRLTDYFVHINPETVGVEDYAVIMAESSTINLNVNLREPWVDQNAYRTLLYATGVDVNLTTGVVANLLFDYSFVTLFTSNSETRPTINITL